MKKKISVLLMVLVMVLCSTATSFASIDNGIVPYDTGNVTFIIDRISGTSADASVSVQFTSTADQYSVVIYLQKMSNGTWINDSSNEDYVFYNNGFNSNYCLFENIYDSLAYGTTYRLMVVSRDVKGGIESRSTIYSNSF